MEVCTFLQKEPHIKMLVLDILFIKSTDAKIVEVFYIDCYTRGLIKGNHVNHGHLQFLESIL